MVYMTVVIGAMDVSIVTPVSGESAISIPWSEKPALRSASSSRVALRRSTSPLVLLLHSDGRSDKSPTTTWYKS